MQPRNYKQFQMRRQDEWGYPCSAAMRRIKELEQELADVKRGYIELRKDWNYFKPHKMHQALLEIASCQSHAPSDVVDVARRALPDRDAS